jgi:hypothetical protein
MRMKAESDSDKTGIPGWLDRRQVREMVREDLRQES